MDYTQLSEFPDRDFEIVLHRKLPVAPRDLVAVLGEPSFSFTEPGDKVSREWVFTDGDYVFSVYDYKKTSLYDNDLPEPVVFWGSDTIAHISVGREERIDDQLEWHRTRQNPSEMRGHIFYAWLRGRLYQDSVMQSEAQS